MSYALAQGINGVFEGMDWRERRDARKEDRARQKKLDKMREERHGWDREAHELRMKTGNREENAAAGETDFWNEAFDAATESYNSQNPETPAPGAPGATLGRPTAPQSNGAAQPAVSAPAAPPTPAIDPSGVPVPVQEQPAPQAADVPAAQPVVASGAPGVGAARVGPDAAAERALVGYMPDAGPGALPDAPPNPQGRSAISYEQWRGMSRAERKRHGMPESEIGGQWYFKNRNGAYDFLIGGRETPETGPRLKGTPHITEDSPKVPAAEQAVAGAARPNMPVPSTPEGTPIHSAASVAETVQTVTPLSAPGAKRPGQKVKATKQQVERASKSFLDHYMEVSAPKIVQHYLRKGDVKKAQEFQNFLDSKDTEEGIQAWSQAIFAAQVGDEDGFADALADAYNSHGYDADGYEVMRDGTTFTYDEQGNVTGAIVKLKNQKTGQTFDQIFDGVDDIYRFGIEQLSPEVVFEKGIARAEAAEQYEIEMARKQAEMRARGITPDDVFEAIEKLGKANIGFIELSVAEQVEAAMQAIRQVQGAGAPGASMSTPPPPVNGDPGPQVPIY